MGTKSSAATTLAELKNIQQRVVAFAEQNAERTKGTAQHKTALRHLAIARKLLDEIERDA